MTTTRLILKGSLRRSCQVTPSSHGSWLWLDTQGANTAASLAAAEHVSQQAIAQNLAVLKADGLVEMKPDPADRRKSLISMTPAGRLLVESIYASRDDWLIRAIESAVGLDERTDMDNAIELLERLAGVELNPHQGIR